MARPLRFSEMFMLRLEPGTAAEIDRLSADDEARADFIRAAIEREIARRIRAQQRSTPKLMAR